MSSSDKTLSWLLKRLGVCPNAYYNYRKHRKADYYAQKAEVQEQIKDIYHSHNGGAVTAAWQLISNAGDTVIAARLSTNI